MKTKAYSYIRMSTDKQQQGDSLRRQRVLAEAFCKRHDLVLDDQFKLIDAGYSAFSGDHLANGSLGHFLEAVRAGQIPKGSYLLIESHDRLSRMEPRKALPVFLDLLNAGINVAVLNQDKVFRPETNDPFEIMQALLEMVRSHGESKRKSDMGKASWDNKRANMSKSILTSMAPGWLKAREDRSGFDPIPDKVKIVELMFAMTTTENMGADAIARELNRRGIRPFGRAKRGWQKSSVQKVLKSRAVIGHFEPHRKWGSVRIPTGQVSKDYYPAVIDEETFYMAQHKLRSRKVSGGGRLGSRLPNLFTKLVRCGYCGGSMHYVDKGKKGGKSLVCDTARRKVTCHAAPWSYADFEKSALSFVREINAQHLTNEFVHASELANLRRALEAVLGKLSEEQARRKRIFDLLTGAQATEFAGQQYAEADARVAELQREAVELQERTARLRSENEGFTEGSQSLLTLLDRTHTSNPAGYEQLRRRLRTALTSIVDEIMLFPLGPLATNRLADHPDASPVNDKEKGRFVVLDNFSTSVVPGDKRRRHFVISFKDGTRRRVKPNPAEPTAFDWIGEGDADPVTREQIVEMARVWGLDASSPTDFETVRLRLAAMVDENACSDDAMLKAHMNRHGDEKA